MIKVIDARSIKSNNQYRLIYQYNGAPTLSAEITFTGEELMLGLAHMECLMIANDASYHELRSGYLIPVLEVWGLMKNRSGSIRVVSQRD